MSEVITQRIRSNQKAQKQNKIFDVWSLIHTDWKLQTQKTELMIQSEFYLSFVNSFIYVV